MTELQIQHKIVMWLQSQGIYAFSVSNESAGRSVVMQMQLVSAGLRKGVSDLVLLFPGGKTVFLEIKTPTGKQSKAQEHFQRRVEELGFKYAIARSLQDVVELLDLLGYRS